jgi:hypothetical protein
VIRHICYLACDVCLEICDDSDADSGKEARALGRWNGYKRLRGPSGLMEDVCRKCQADPTRRVA